MEPASVYHILLWTPRVLHLIEYQLQLLLLLLSCFSPSDSVQPHRWQPTRLPRPWDSPGKNTGVD